MENIDATAYITGIAHPHRMEWLRATIDYMDSQNFPFKKKIISIDQFNGNKVKDEDVEYFAQSGWTVLIDSHHSRKSSFDRAFKEIDTNFLFYNEDDVQATLPKIEDLNIALFKEVDDKLPSMISMTLGGTKFDPETKDIGDLKFMEENVILESDDYIIFRRLEDYANSYFFEFPGLWIRTQIFKDCHEAAKTIGGQIETGLTQAYWNNKYKEKFYKASIAKKGSLQILLEDPRKVNSHCRLLTNLDPLQGNNPAGGNHKY